VYLYGLIATGPIAMPLPRLRTALLSLLCTLSAIAGPALAQAEQPSIATVKGSSYAATREALVDAIEAQGLVAGPISHFGEMLARTGPDLGKPKPIYGDAEVIQFCSAVAAWQMAEEDPHNIVNCPLSIAIYTLAGQPATVYLAYRVPGRSTVAVRRAAELLRDIVAATVDQARRR
jgi:hypothetical protein